MADAVKSTADAVEPAPAHRTRDGLRPAARRFSFSRVRLAYFLLVLALGGAAAGLVLALEDGGSAKGKAAASARPAGWRPLGTGSTAARQVAQHVAAEYRQADGKPLVAVIARAPAVQNVPISTVVMRADTSGSATPHPLQIGDAVMYLLCGTAQDCSIGSGTPSAARGRLIRREALELSLDTFRFVEGIQTVIVFLPPVAGSNEKRLAVLTRSNLASELGRPLPHRALRPGQIGKKEGARIDAATVPATFVLVRVQQLPDQTLALLLTPQALPSL